MSTTAARHAFQSTQGATGLSGAGATGVINAAQTITSNSQSLGTVLPNSSSRQLCNYLVTLTLANTNTTASIVEVMDGGSTIIWTGYIPSDASVQPNPMTFDPPLKGSPATAMNIRQVSASALVWSASGFAA